jgi:hypothetical protein
MMLFSLLLGVGPTQRWHPLDSHIRRQNQTEMMSPWPPTATVLAKHSTAPGGHFLFYSVILVG